MTREEILKLEAGREMDALVAEKVMGWKNVCRKHNYLDYGSETLISGGFSPVLVGQPVGYAEDKFTSVPRYSTDISTAWEVVSMFLYSNILRPFSRKWQVALAKDASGLYHGVATEDTAPLAICRAALLSVEEEEE